MSSHSCHPGAADLVRRVRERRFADGVSCPRCGSASVVRWGQFAGRQRYRCRACGRCFSDLTGTAFSYVKKLHAWPPYFRCLSASLTVRRSAAEVGVAASTSFRWRHLVLQSIRPPDAAQLRGLVEFAETSFPYSVKGNWRGKPPEWTPAMYYGLVPVFCRPGCIVMVALDRHGSMRAERLDTGTRTGDQLRALFADGLADDCTLLCSTGRYGPYGALQRTSTGASRPFVKVSWFGGQQRDTLHNRNAHGWLRRLRRWLLAFRGVSTRYMPNYLEWRRVLDLVEAGPWLKGLITCLLGNQAANTSREQKRTSQPP